ncbi:hypothetical protein O1L60_01050 [Streptomyces diastatochromogenes]|nr:hypothetical protein [Streptomyces diastatochromogenes]
MTTSAKPGPRERLLLAAQELTYRQGVGVGVDALLKGAESPAARCTSTSAARTASSPKCCAAAPPRTWSGTAPPWPRRGRPRDRLLAVVDRLAAIAAAPTSTAAGTSPPTSRSRTRTTPDTRSPGSTGAPSTACSPTSSPPSGTRGRLRRRPAAPPRRRPPRRRRDPPRRRTRRRARDLAEHLVGTGRA